MHVDGATPLWVATRVLLYEREDDFFRRRDKALKTSDPEDIHDLRVSSRRLREGLALFSPCYPAGKVARLVKPIKRVTRLLGEVRNSDEAVLFFTALADELDALCRGDLEQLTLAFRVERAKELKRLRRGLREFATTELRDLFRRVINAPSLFAPATSGCDLFAPLAEYGKEALTARLAHVERFVPEARHAAGIEAQHLLRIAVKHFRYRLEILSFLLGARSQDLLAAAKGYQDVLGRMHDLDVFAGIVREAGFPASTKEAALCAIAARRGRLFADFSGMLEITSFAEIGAQMRSIG